MSLFSIGLSGLNTAQTALQTTSSNVSNVFTPGYNRQLTIVGENATGGGVQVNDVERQFNRYVADQLNDATGKKTALDAYAGQVGQIDNLLADRDAGLAPLMQNFFSSLEDLAGAPSDPAARQGVIGTADTLTAQFRSFDSYLDDMQSGINGKIKDEVTQINNTAKQVAGLNREIALAKAKTGEAPNSLLNQRDQLVAQLSERIGVELVNQDGASYNLTIGNGQPLVSGRHSFSLEAVTSPMDPSRTVVAYRDAGGNLMELDDATFDKGALGGLMTFRRETLDKTQNQIGQMALALASDFNAQHAKGQDLDGEPGKDFFDIGSPRVLFHDKNTGNATVSVGFVDSRSVTASDYDVRFEGPGTADFVVTRRDTGEEISLTTIKDEDGNLVKDADGNEIKGYDGLKITVTGTPANGDRFEIQPTRNLAGEIENLVSDTSKIAAAELDPGNVSSGDNRNALALQNLQNKNIVGGRASINEAYASMVGDVGNRTNVVKANQAAQEGLTEQLTAVQQSESGVNLDEEAANLIRYQQYYQANAKVIETGGRLLDSILNLR